MALGELLTKSLQAAGYRINSQAQQQLLDYLLLLEKWNKTYNLTRIADPTEMVSKHILDSLAIGPFLHGKKILDVGSGAGLPGIPLAIAYPDLHFTLLDSNGKKTRFLTQAIALLTLSNVQIVQARVEAFKPSDSFDSIVARAFSSLAEFLSKTQHLCSTTGQFFAMKGQYPTEELAVVKPEFKLLKIQELAINGFEATRHLLCFARLEPKPH